jgi:hypothetical protein
VIPASLADPLRYLDAGLALLLVAACGRAIALSRYWDQRVRFGIFAAFGFLLTGGHLNTLGREGSWYLAALIVVVLVALVSTAATIRRELREREARGRRAR